MRPIACLALPITLAAMLTACGRVAPPVGAMRGTSMAAKGLWSKPPALRPGKLEGRVRVDGVNTSFLKDPSFVDGGRAVRGTRYVAFGDLRGFYLKAFDVVQAKGLFFSKGMALDFRAGELPIKIEHLPGRLDALWAPEIRVTGDTIELVYSAGEMPPPEGPRWSTFHLRHATIPLDAFEVQTVTDGPLYFQDQGPLMEEGFAPFGPEDHSFGVIDPNVFQSPNGATYLTYTIVRPPTATHPGHEELVRARRVDPEDLDRPLGADKPIYDGLQGTEDDGVAEASDVLSLKGQTYVFISSRPGDVDQRLLVGRADPDLGRLPREQVQPFMYPGAQAWKSKAIGSSGAAVINNTAYMIYQGLDANHRFTLGWTTLEP